MRVTRRRLLMCAAVTLLAAPVVWVLASARAQDKLEHVYERLTFQVIADRVIQGRSEPQAALSKLLEYVHLQVVSPPNDARTGDLAHPLDILAVGRGYCDQQANVFAQLARTIPVDVQMTFLHDASGASPHSVAEVYLDGAWRVVDPLLGVPILNHEGALATREELARDPALLTELPQLDALRRLDSPDTFSKTVELYQHPATVFNTWRGRRKAWLSRLPTPAQRGLVGVLQSLSFALPTFGRELSPSERLLLRARHYGLLNRFRAAARTYAQLLARSDQPGLRQEARYFSGRLLARQGRSAEALQAFQDALSEDPSGPWSPFVYRAIGKLYEDMAEPASAVEAYRRSIGLRADPVIAHRVVSLVAARSKAQPAH